jgi:pimeloyl-ACP methyl ester carboxylesterase
MSRKSRWLVATLAVILIVMAAGATFFLRPVMTGLAIQQISMWTHGIHSRYVQLGPYRIHYLVAGEGRPLVLVHGLGVRAEVWLPVMPVFAGQGYRVYAPDLLGYGRSDKPDVDYGISLQTGIVRQFMDSQDLRQADVAGWSMGGWTSLKLAADSPQRVSKLILMDSAGMRFDAVNASALRPTTVEELAHMMKVLTPHPPVIPRFIALDTLRTMKAQDWIVARALTSMASGSDLMDGRLQSVTMPVLIVWGGEDVLTPLSIAEQMRREMPQAKLFLAKGCGHLAPVECQDQIVPAMQAFLAK